MSKFKCPVTNNLLTQALFWDLKFDRERSIYTLKEEDHVLEDGRVLPALKRLYLETKDPTEYTFATTYFYSWNHWQRCLGNKLILEHVEKWREELELLLMAEGFQGVLEQAATDKGYQAAKWLAEKGWLDKRAGRPTKATVEGELKQAARLKNQYQDDLDRVSEFLQ